MVQAQALPKNFVQTVKAYRKRFLWIGIALCVLGVVAILFPFAAGIATTIWIGWMLIIAGAVMLWHAFQSKGWSTGLGIGAIALMNLVAGAWLAFSPLSGLFTLTVFLAVLFFAEGIVKTVTAFRARSEEGWIWLLISGFASVLLAILLFMGLPGSAFWVLGVLVGLNFLSSGISLIMLTRLAKQL